MGLKPSESVHQAEKPSALPVRLTVRTSEEVQGLLAQYALRHPGTTVSHWLRAALEAFVASVVVPELEARPTQAVVAEAQARGLMEKEPPEPLESRVERLMLKYDRWHRSAPHEADGWMRQLLYSLDIAGGEYHGLLNEALRTRLAGRFTE